MSSLRMRLMAVYVGLVIIGFGGLTLWFANQIATAAYDDFGNSLRINALFLANRLRESLEHNSAEATRLIANAAADFGVQVTVYDRQGRLFLNSEEEAISLRPSDSYLVEDGLITAMAEIREDNSELLGYIQLTAPTAVLLESIYQRWLALGISFLGFSLLGLAGSLWLLGTLIRPLSNLRDTALQMAEGDLSQRVDDLPQDEIGEVGRAFNEMAERVEALVAEQRAFASNASHELRTPLTAIRLRTEALQNDELEIEIKAQYIAEIDQETKRMGQLVDDLLMLSRLDAKRLAIGYEEIDAVRLLQLLIREYASLAAEKQIALTFDLPELPVVVQANLTHLQVVLNNLIDNALKYTPPQGEVRVQLKTNGRAAELTVRDSGRGIAAADLPHIGQRFYRADKARTREVQGVGLGLALVSSIVELYGGSFAITSEGLNQGTTAVVLWPLGEAAA